MNLLRRVKRLPAKVALTMNRREYRRSPRRVLQDDQRSFWEQNGYLILPGHFSREEMDAVNRFVDEIWVSSKQFRRPTVVDIYIGTSKERRVLLSDAPLEAKRHPYKLNDLFLESDLVRSIVLQQRLSLVLEELLGGPPLVCNTLNLEFGSQQADHYDSLYMAAPVDQHLVATWIGLEDCDPDAGPLRYFPGSHAIPPYRFSNGGTAAVDEEMSSYADRMREELGRRGIEVERFLPKSGDVLIWHSQLFHGGEQINDPSLTRRSLVTHYWRAKDLLGQHGRVGLGRYYLIRPQQQVGL